MSAGEVKGSKSRERPREKEDEHRAGEKEHRTGNWKAVEGFYWQVGESVKFTTTP